MQQLYCIQLSWMISWMTLQHHSLTQHWLYPDIYFTKSSVISKVVVMLDNHVILYSVPILDVWGECLCICHCFAPNACCALICAHTVNNYTYVINTNYSARWNSSQNSFSVAIALNNCTMAHTKAKCLVTLLNSNEQRALNSCWKCQQMRTVFSTLLCISKCVKMTSDARVREKVEDTKM